MSKRNVRSILTSQILQCDVQGPPGDVEISHKLKRKNDDNAIIAKFCSHEIKTKLYRQRTRLKNTKASDLLPGYATASA